MLRSNWTRGAIVLALLNVAMIVSMPTDVSSAESLICGGGGVDCACKVIDQEWGCFEEIEPVEWICTRSADCQ